MAMMGFSNYWGKCKTCTSQYGTMKFCMLTRASMNKQLLVIPLWRKSKNTNMVGTWKFKNVFFFKLRIFWEVLHSIKNMAVHPRRFWASYSLPWELEISHILFYGEKWWTVSFRQTKLWTLTDHGHTYTSYFNHYFLWQSFLNMVVVRHFEVILGQTLNYFL
jgi:hypothetical protein